MVGSSGEKIIVSIGRWSCGACVKGLQANTIKHPVSGVSDVRVQFKILLKIYGSVKSSCNLANTLDGDGGADLAATVTKNIYRNAENYDILKQPRRNWISRNQPITSSNTTEIIVNCLRRYIIYDSQEGTFTR